MNQASDCESDCNLSPLWIEIVPRVTICMWGSKKCPSEVHHWLIISFLSPQICKGSYFPWNTPNLPACLSEIFHESSESNLPFSEVTILVECVVLQWHALGSGRSGYILTANFYLWVLAICFHIISLPFKNIYKMVWCCTSQRCKVTLANTSEVLTWHMATRDSC